MECETNSHKLISPNTLIYPNQTLFICVPGLLKYFLTYSESVFDQYVTKDQLYVLS